MLEAVLKELGKVTAWFSTQGRDSKCTRLRALQEVNGRNTGSKPPEFWDKDWSSIAWFAAFLGETESLGTRSWLVPSYNNLDSRVTFIVEAGLGFRAVRGVLVYFHPLPNTLIFSYPFKNNVAPMTICKANKSSSYLL